MSCKIYFDKLPDTKEKVSNFKGYLSGLSNSPEFQTGTEDQGEVNSTDYDKSQETINYEISRVTKKIVKGACDIRLTSRLGIEYR